MTKKERIEKSLAALYEFRVNEITGTVEFRRKGELVYRRHTDFNMNSIIREIEPEANVTISQQAYAMILNSDFSKQYHPIRDYFTVHLAGKSKEISEEHIKKMAETVTVPNPDIWFLSLKRWLVASVANGLTPFGCQNHTCIVFTGGMGLFKTTWLMNLCPPPLNPEMAFTGKIDLNLANKDTFSMLGTKFIMNLDDQLRNLMKKDGETMKTIITHPEISIRRPYSKFAETMARVANFLASINGEEFLAENENRRFLPFRVQAIDINLAQSMDIDEVWNEAYNIFIAGLELQAKAKNGNKDAAELFDKEYRYWWTKEELELAFPDMQSFAYASDELEMITSYFEIPATKEFGNCTMNATEIAAFLKAKTGGLLPSTRKIGEALKKLQTPQVSVRSNGTPITKYVLINRDQVPEPSALQKRQEELLENQIFGTSKK